MSRPIPEHGTQTCYRYGCRRAECRNADRLARKRDELRRLRGVPGHVDGTRVASHIRLLLATGWTVQELARTTRISYRTITYVLSGQRSMQTRNAVKILAIKPLNGPSRVDATGTRRRIQALARIGWTLKTIAQRSGHSYSYFARILNGSVTAVSRDTADQVAVAYRSLVRTQGPSLGTRTIAERNGWHGPFAWDESTIDDPNAAPDISENGVMNRDELAEYRRQEIAHLVSFGVPEHEIAARLGMSPHYVHDLIRDRLSAAA